MQPPTWIERVMLWLGLRVWKCRATDRCNGIWEHPEMGRQCGREPGTPYANACPLVHVWIWQRPD